MESRTTVISVLKVNMYNNSGLRFLDFQLLYEQNCSGKEIGLCFTCANLALVTFFCKSKQTFATLYGLEAKIEVTSQEVKFIYLGIL